MSKFDYTVNVADIPEEYEADLVSGDEYLGKTIIEETDGKKIKTKKADFEKILNLRKGMITKVEENAPAFVMPISVEEAIKEEKDLNSIVENKVNEQLYAIKEEIVKSPIVEEPIKTTYSFEEPIVEEKESTTTSIPKWREGVFENNKNNNLSYARSIALNYLDVIDKFARQLEDPTVGEHQRKALENSVVKLQGDLSAINRIKDDKQAINDKITELKAQLTECDEEIKKNNNIFSDDASAASKAVENGRKVDILLIEQKRKEEENKLKLEKLQQEVRAEEEKSIVAIDEAKKALETSLFVVEEKPILSVITPKVNEPAKELDAHNFNFDNSENDDNFDYDFDGYLEAREGLRRVA